ncbi:hypothetical protein BDV97DRAFT_108642 [Delphinella strobiligena]|nr:hypothetical protein BDV97DRAFT_108642 [Delphinella strobiligena]
MGDGEGVSSSEENAGDDDSEEDFGGWGSVEHFSSCAFLLVLVVGCAVCGLFCMRVRDAFFVMRNEAEVEESIKNERYRLGQIVTAEMPRAHTSRMTAMLLCGTQIALNISAFPIRYAFVKSS